MSKKYVLITGSSKGLGLEIGKVLSYAGYNIILIGRNKESLLSSLNHLNSELKHIIIKLDLSEDDFIKTLSKKIKKLNIFAVVHNYGINYLNDSHPINIDILDKSIYNNFTVSLKINEYLMNHCSEILKKIIYIGSTASLHAKASPSYVISKGIINLYVKNVSQEYLNKGIFICALLPGILAHKGSSWNKKKKTDRVKYEETEKRQPLGRFAMPSDIAEYVLGLMKQKNFMLTGSIIKLDANEY